jgi:acyl-CoA reductase-like NAD-dependent aldehyde dehydrogenase
MTSVENKTTHVDVTSPCDGSLIKTLPLQTAEDAERMLQIGKRLLQDRVQWLGADRRMAILNKLADLVAAESEEFALLIAREGGKPLRDARVEVARAVAGIRLAAEEIPCVLRGQQIPMGLTPETQNRVAFTLYEPIGQVVAISAFNHPLNLIVHQVVPAVAVGCPVIVKPALTTPLNCLRFCELLNEAGLPPGWCQPIICDDQVAERLVTDRRVAFLSFIGSARVGWKLRGKLAPGARCALEHGGAAPVILDEDIDFEEVIPPTAQRRLLSQRSGLRVGAAHLRAATARRGLCYAPGPGSRTPQSRTRNG